MNTISSLSDMELRPISLDPALNTEFENNPGISEGLQMSIDFFKKIGFDPPWIGYCVKLNKEFVGNAAFKGKPKDNKVEIAYGTFAEHRNKGIASEICRQLVLLALRTEPDVIITARTLPEENASAHVLRKNGFVLLGNIWDDEDGNVWEWEYKGTGPIVNNKN
jgi:ribosomal-protein-alanine N-acetyltransferase